MRWAMQLREQVGVARDPLHPTVEANDRPCPKSLSIWVGDPAVENAIEIDWTRSTRHQEKCLVLPPDQADPAIDPSVVECPAQRFDSVADGPFVPETSFDQAQIQG